MRVVVGHIVWRAVRRLLGLVCLVVLLLIATGAAIVVQGGREEADRAETAVVVADGDALGRAARVERAIQLYLGGRVSRLVILGREPGALQDQLLARGVQPTKLVAVRQDTQRAQFDDLRTAYLAGQANDAVLVAEPVQMLRLLKMAHDRGIALRGFPTSQSSAIDLGGVIDEIVQYFRYMAGGD